MEKPDKESSVELTTFGVKVDKEFFVEDTRTFPLTIGGGKDLDNALSSASTADHVDAPISNPRNADQKPAEDRDMSRKSSFQSATDGAGSAVCGWPPSLKFRRLEEDRRNRQKPGEPAALLEKRTRIAIALSSFAVVLGLVAILLEAADVGVKSKCDCTSQSGEIGSVTVVGDIEAEGD